MPTPAPLFRAPLLLAASALLTLAGACTSLTEPSENLVVKEQRPTKAAPPGATATGLARPPVAPTAQPQPRPLSTAAIVGSASASASPKPAASAAPKTSAAPKPSAAPLKPTVVDPHAGHGH
jgi:hypothetical protein